MSEKFNLGTNISGSIKGKTLTLEIDLGQEHGKTQKGFDRIASTGGNLSLPGGEKIGLNIYRK